MKYNQYLRDRIEELIDANSLKDVLFAIEEICYGKASHVAEAWQDSKLSRTWTVDGNRVAKCAARIIN